MRQAIYPIVGLLFPANLLLADDFPHFASVHSTEDQSKLNISCELADQGNILCSFREAAVRLKENPDDLDELIAQAMQQIESEDEFQEIVTMSCSAIEMIKEGFETDLDVQDRLTAMTGAERAMVDLNMGFFENICEQQSIESVKAMIEHYAEVETRTCVFSTGSWTQEFQRSTDDLWTATPPERLDSMCGVIPLDRLERTEDGHFWRYINRSLAANPNAEFLGDISCSDEYDGSEKVYKFSSNSFPIQCDYVEFGVMY